MISFESINLQSTFGFIPQVVLCSVKWPVNQDLIANVFINTKEKENLYWETRNVVGTRAIGECFHSFSRVLPNFHECFYMYNSIETRRTCFLFLTTCYLRFKNVKLILFACAIITQLFIPTCLTLQALRGLPFTSNLALDREKSTSHS